MKCKIGFLTARDEVTKKEVPFFLKVRAKDIISVDIANPLKQTSKFFDPDVYKNSEYSEFLGVDCSEFHYKCNFTKEEDYRISTGQITTGEAKFYNVMQSEITYRIMRSGLYEIFGIQTVSSPVTNPTLPQISNSGWDWWSAGTYHCITLPFECPGVILNAQVNLLDNINTVKSRSCNFSLKNLITTAADLNDSEKHKYIIAVQPYSSSATFGFTIRGHI